MKFSIIIPVRSVNKFLLENIEHLKKVRFEDFEVIIITDDETKNTFGDNRIRLISSGPVSPGEKRNLGAKNASGEFLAFLDDDAYPTEEWLENAWEILKSNNTYALGGPAVTPLNAEVLEKCSGEILMSKLTSAGTAFRHTPMPERSVDDYPTVNLFVKREAFLMIGGFDKNYWPGEDTKLCLDLVKHFGKPFLYHPSPVVYHHRRNIFLPHLKQVSRYGFHRGRFAIIFPETSRKLSYFMPSLFVLGIISGAMASVIFPSLLVPYLAVITLYLFALIIESIRIFAKTRNPFISICTSVGILLTHLVYGTNFLRGLFKAPKLELRGINQKTGSYTGG